MCPKDVDICNRFDDAARRHELVEKGLPVPEPTPWTPKKAAGNPNCSVPVKSPGWKPGQGGNPNGNPENGKLRAGTKNKLTMLAEAILTDAAPDVAKKVIEKAKSEDIVACRLVLQLPSAAYRKGINFKLEVPDEHSASALETASRLFGAGCALENEK